MAFKILLIVLAVWIVVAAVGLLAAHLSGRINRAYPVTPPGQLIEIAGKEKSAGSWAEDFRPVMFLRSVDFSPPLLRTLYEVVEGEDDVYFVYYQVWEDEVHPNAFYHKAYRLFRAAYYGIPVRDIEYFEVVVNRRTGEIKQLMFETSPGEDYNVTLSEHLIARVTHASNGSFTMSLTRKNGSPVSTQENYPVSFEGRHPLVGAVTWNHLTGLVNPQDDHFNVRLSAPLVYLSDEEYAKAKFVRKSHGTFQTDETGISAAAGLLGIVAIVFPLGMVMRLAGWIKGKAGRRSKAAQA